MVRMQWWMRPGPSRPCAISNPRPSPSSRFDGRHADVLERDLHVAVRRVVIAVDRQRARSIVTPGASSGTSTIDCCWWRRGFGIGLAHQDRDLAARIARARRPPFPAVDDVVVAVALDPALDVGRVGAGDARLGHQEGRADLAPHQRRQPLLLLLARAVAVEHFHVAGVGRRAVEHLRATPTRPISSAHSAYSRLVSCSPSNGSFRRHASARRPAA